MSIRIGIDLGGTKIEIIALDDQGKAVVRRRVFTPRDNYPAILNTIKTLIFSVEQELGCKATVGVGIPGALCHITGLVKNSNTQCLIGKAFDKDLEKILHRDVLLCNDANCFTLSEAVDGAGKGHNLVFGVILGTGTGGGFVINQRVLKGLNSIAGEWGHNPLPWPNSNEIPGPKCYCGKYGCLETFLSGDGFAFDYFQLMGESLSPPQIVSQALNGEDGARKCLDRYINRLSRGLASVINVVDPDVIVLGGGLSNIKSLYNEVPLCWKDYVFSDRIDTLLRPALHGDSSGVRGAAWLWPSSN